MRAVYVGATVLVAGLMSASVVSAQVPAELAKARLERADALAIRFVSLSLRRKKMFFKAMYVHLTRTRIALVEAHLVDQRERTDPFVRRVEPFVEPPRAQ